MNELRPERLHLQDVRAQHLTVCGRHFIADPSGALYWPNEQALIIGNIDLGLATPEMSQKNTLKRPRSLSALKDLFVLLAQTIEYYDARTVIALGLETLQGAETISIDDKVLGFLSLIQAECEWIWVDEKNCDDHKPDLTQAENDLGGTLVSELHVDAITFRHVPLDQCITHEIAAGLQPAARTSTWGQEVRRSCFVGNGRRLVLPSFGNYTSGVNILDQRFAKLFDAEGLAAWMIGQDGVYPVSTRRLIQD